MNTFEAQFARLSFSAQMKFVRRWNTAAPWKDPRYNQPQDRMAWKRQLDPMPAYPRWEKNTHPESPLWMALRARNRRAARDILRRTDALSRREAGACALLTLQWAPDLLQAVLDKTPRRPFAWLHYHRVIDRDQQQTLVLEGSLVMIAAALDDLPSLNLLLERGDHPDLSFPRDRWAIMDDLLMNGVTMPQIRSPHYRVGRFRPFPDDEDDAFLDNADPLSAAIFCNAKRCAARLLKEPSVTITPAVRETLAALPANETQALVTQQLGVPLEDILRPEDFGPEVEHPLLPAVLKRHNGVLPRPAVEQLLTQFTEAKGDKALTRLTDLLALIDAHLLGDVVWERIQHDPLHRLIMLARIFALPVDRCRVQERLPRAKLLTLMDNFLITGDPPEGGLSGLACALLTQLWNAPSARFSTHTPSAMPVEQLLQLSGAARVLQSEDPNLLLLWLAEHEDRIPTTQSLALKALLNIQKEASYEL